MFNNIGSRIRLMAQFYAGLGFAASVLAGLAGFGWIRNTDPGDQVRAVVLGCGIGLGGILFFWVSSWLMYGFGELIVRTTEVARAVRKSPSTALPLTRPVVEPSVPRKGPVYSGPPPIRHDVLGDAVRMPAS